MPETTWHLLCPQEDLPLGSAKECVAGGRIVAIFHTERGVFALDGICPHQGGPLGKGKLSGCILTCPWHGWQFDVSTGQHQVSAALHQPKYEIKLEDGGIWVSLPE